MKKTTDNSIYKILLNNNRVNNYTKLLLILKSYDYYEDYYIPNRKLMNVLKINKNRIIVLLKQIEKDKMIKLFYKGKKRYFVFIADVSKDEKEEEKPIDLYDYNWLDGDED